MIRQLPLPSVLILILVAPGLVATDADKGHNGMPVAHEGIAAGQAAPAQDRATVMLRRETNEKHSSAIRADATSLMPTKVDIVRRNSPASSGHAPVPPADSSTVLLSPQSTIKTKDHFEAVPDTSSLSEAERMNATVASNRSVEGPHGHIVPWSNGHWHWSDRYKMLVFESNNGQSQQRMEPQMYVKKGVGTDKDMVMAVDTAPGRKLNFNTNSINNEKELRDAEYYDGGKWKWMSHGKHWEVHEVPRWDSIFNGYTKGVTKYVHQLWQNSSSHAPSAYEPDFFRDNSEWFGPFRLDYHTHTVWMDDWNFLVNSEWSNAGRGNFAVGPDQYLEHSTNSFVAGRRNVARGNGNSVLGGTANLAKGENTVIVGGEGNVASGKGAVGSGGFHNYARKDYSVAIGGQRNMAEGDYSAEIGGRAGLNEAQYGVIAGGNANSIREAGAFATVAGGTGNKATAPYSVVRGGAGGMTKKRFEILTGVMPGSDMAIQAAMSNVEKEVGEGKEGEGKHGGEAGGDETEES